MLGAKSDGRGRLDHSLELRHVHESDLGSGSQAILDDLPPLEITELDLVGAFDRRG